MKSAAPGTIPLVHARLSASASLTLSPGGGVNAFSRVHGCVSFSFARLLFATRIDHCRACSCSCSKRPGFRFSSRSWRLRYSDMDIQPFRLRRKSLRINSSGIFLGRAIQAFRHHRKSKLKEGRRARPRNDVLLRTRPNVPTAVPRSLIKTSASCDTQQTHPICSVGFSEALKKR